eukprot:629184-Hanusia_phi.AAC.4
MGKRSGCEKERQHSGVHSAEGYEQDEEKEEMERRMKKKEERRKRSVTTHPRCFRLAQALGGRRRVGDVFGLQDSTMLQRLCRELF